MYGRSGWSPRTALNASTQWKTWTSWPATAEGLAEPVHVGGVAAEAVTAEERGDHAEFQGRPPVAVDVACESSRRRCSGSASLARATGPERRPPQPGPDGSPPMRQQDERRKSALRRARRASTCQRLQDAGRPGPSRAKPPAAGPDGGARPAAALPGPGCRIPPAPAPDPSKSTAAAAPGRPKASRNTATSGPIPSAASTSERTPDRLAVERDQRRLVQEGQDQQRRPPDARWPAAGPAPA